MMVDLRRFLCLSGIIATLLCSDAVSADKKTEPDNDVTTPPVCSTPHECVNGLALNLRRDVPLDASPWKVFQLFVYDSLDHHSGQIYTKGLSSLADGSQFRDPELAQRYADFLRAKAIAISTKALTDVGTPQVIATQISERMARPYIDNLERALVTNALQAQSKTQRQLRDALHKTSGSSLDHLLAKDVDSKAFVSDISTIVKQATPSIGTEQRANVARLIRSAFDPLETVDLSPEELDRLHKNLDRVAAWSPHQIDGLQKKILSYMTTDASDAFVKMKNDVERNHALDAIANEVVMRADENISSVARNLNSVSKGAAAESALNILSRIGDFQELQRQSAAKILSGGIDVTGSLGELNKVVGQHWDSVYQSVAAATQQQGLPPELVKAASVAHIVNDFSRILQGGAYSSTLPADMLNGLSAIAKENGDLSHVDLLVSGFKAIADGKASAFQASGAVLTSLASVVPALAPLSDTFNKFAPIMQAASPLLALSSFASPAGFIQLAGMFGGGGGLFGGGHDDSEQLAAINQALIQISKQLAEISKQLDALQKQIQQNQIQIMDALESISYDVNRFRDLFVSTSLDKTFGSCQEFKGNVDKAREPFVWPQQATADLREAHSPLSNITKCDVGLDTFMSTDEGQKLRLAVYNVASTNVSRDNALTKLKAAANTYRKSTSANANCLNLMLGAISLHDVDTSRSISPATDEQRQLCRAILNVNDMRDPVVLAYTISVEESIANDSTKFGIRAATGEFWTPNRRRTVLGRWADELKELNIGIAQHSLLSGDATLADWGVRLSDPSKLDSDSIEVLKGNEILAANAARYWLWHDNSATSASPISVSVDDQAIYTFAYHACDPDFVSMATGKPQDVFKWTDAVEDKVNNGYVVEQDEKKPRGPCPTTDSGKNQSTSRWCAAFANIGCVDLPTPLEYSTHQLRHTSSLEALLQSRDNLLTTIETTRLIEQLFDPSDRNSEARRLQLLEAIAIQWRVEHAVARRTPIAPRPRKTKVFESDRIGQQVFASRALAGASSSSDSN